MTTASELITRGLRLINIPGRGATLGGADTNAAFEVLQEIIAAEGVSRSFVPGIRRHFFELTPNRSIYSYGPGGDLDTDPFNDLTPVRIEDAYIREGSAIVSNEQVTNGGFDVVDNWTLAAGWTIGAGVLTIAPDNSTATAEQVLALGPGTYTLRFDAFQRGGMIMVQVSDGVANPINLTISGNGEYSFTFEHSGGASAITFTAVSASDFDIDNVSILEDGKDLVELPDVALGGGGSDYRVTVIDQNRYNGRFTKGTGGRPYEILFSRTWPVGELRLDNSAIAGDILVMDVLAAPQVRRLTDSIPLHGDAETWLKYELANQMAGEYGKELRPSQRQTLNRAWDRMAAGNKRKNNRRVDGALRKRPTFDINRGDP